MSFLTRAYFYEKTLNGSFYGVTSDFEPADDNEMSKFLGF